jgi:hypothetical protein
MSVMGGAPLLAALALVALMPDPSPMRDATAAVPTRTAETAASRSSREAAAVTPSATPTRPSGEPADLASVSTEDATADLRRAGITVEGTIHSAWGWTDTQGRSLVAAIRDVTAQAHDGSPTGVALWVYYLTGLDDGEPEVRRKLKDPALRCNDKGVVTAGYTGSAFGVRDLDGNGTPEVMLGWTARCGEPAAASRVRLAVISGSKLYVLRGTGVVTGQAAHEGTGTDPGGPVVVGAPPPDGSAPDPTTVPAASQWPAAVLDAALATFHGSYY